MSEREEKRKELRKRGWKTKQTRGGGVQQCHVLSSIYIKEKRERKKKVKKKKEKEAETKKMCGHERRRSVLR